MSLESLSEKEKSPSDVSHLLLEEDIGGVSVLYSLLILGRQSEVAVPERGLEIDLNLTDIEDFRVLERITGEIKLLLEDSRTRDRFASVHVKIKRSQMNRQITNYRMAFPSRYEVIEDIPDKF